MNRVSTASFLIALGAVVLQGAVASAAQPAAQPAAQKAAPQSAAVGAVQPNVPRLKGLWSRYVDAGEAAMKKNDTETAKRYFLGALSELEKNSNVREKNAPNFMILAQVSTMERELANIYKNGISKNGNDETQQLAVRTEQVSTLQRIADINQKLVKPNDLLLSKSKERYEAARSELEKAQEKAKSTETSAK